MISDAQIKQYNEEGYTIVENVFSMDELNPILNEFVSDLINDQGVEIERINTLLTGLSDDPRAGLTGGLFIACLLYTSDAADE